MLVKRLYVDLTAIQPFNHLKPVGKQKMNVFESTVISALDQQAKAQELFQATVLLELGIVKDKLQKIKTVKGIALDTEQALKGLAKAEDTELFLSWCEKSSAIEDQIMEAQRALMSFEEELEKTSTDNDAVLKAKDWFIDDCFQISCQTLRAVDMTWGFGSVRHGLREDFGLPED